jgi:hypothetical protein
VNGERFISELILEVVMEQDKGNNGSMHPYTPIVVGLTTLAVTYYLALSIGTGTFNPFEWRSSYQAQFTETEQILPAPSEQTLIDYLKE